MNKAHTEPIFEELPKHLREHFRGQMVGNFKAYEGKGGLLDPDVRRRALRATGYWEEKRRDGSWGYSRLLNRRNREQRRIT